MVLYGRGEYNLVLFIGEYKMFDFETGLALAEY
jgi:hypothetical protein